MPDYVYKITDLNGVDKADIRDKVLTDLETAGNAGKVVTISGANTLSAVDILSSPSLTGTPTAPTATAGTDTTQIATTQFVNSEIAKDAWLLTGGTAIPENADLNNYTTCGNYSTATTAIARTLYNAPWERGSTSGTAFLLKVISPTYGGSNTNHVRQELYTLGMTVKFWGRRRNDNSVWSEWKRVASTDDVPRIITYEGANETYDGVAAEIAAGRVLFCHYSTVQDDVTLPYVCTTTNNKHVFTNMVGNYRWTLYFNKADSEHNTDYWTYSSVEMALNSAVSEKADKIYSSTDQSGTQGNYKLRYMKFSQTETNPTNTCEIVWVYE